MKFFSVYVTKAHAYSLWICDLRLNRVSFTSKRHHYHHHYYHHYGRVKKLLYRKRCKRVKLPVTQCWFFVTIKIQTFHQPGWFFSVFQIYGLVVWLVCVYSIANFIADDGLAIEKEWALYRVSLAWSWRIINSLNHEQVLNTELSLVFDELLACIWF